MKAQFETCLHYVEHVYSYLVKSTGVNNAYYHSESCQGPGKRHQIEMVYQLPTLPSKETMDLVNVIAISQIGSIFTKSDFFPPLQ